MSRDIYGRWGIYTRLTMTRRRLPDGTVVCTGADIRESGSVYPASDMYPYDLLGFVMGTVKPANDDAEFRDAMRRVRFI
jgi:hypothetical protein